MKKFKKFSVKFVLSIMFAFSSALALNTKIQNPTSAMENSTLSSKLVETANIRHKKYLEEQSLATQLSNCTGKIIDLLQFSTQKICKSFSEDLATYLMNTNLTNIEEKADEKAKGIEKLLSEMRTFEKIFKEFLDSSIERFKHKKPINIDDFSKLSELIKNFKNSFDKLSQNFLRETDYNLFVNGLETLEKSSQDIFQSVVQNIKAVAMDSIKSYINENYNNELKDTVRSDYLKKYINSEAKPTVDGFYDTIIRFCNEELQKNNTPCFEKYLEDKFCDNLKRLLKIVDQRITKEVLCNNLYTPTTNMVTTEKNHKNQNLSSSNNVRIFLENQPFDKLRWGRNYLCESTLKNMQKLEKLKEYSNKEFSKEDLNKKIHEGELLRAKLLLEHRIPDTIEGGTASFSNMVNIVEDINAHKKDPVYDILNNNTQTQDMINAHKNTNDAFQLVFNEVKDQFCNSFLLNSQNYDSIFKNNQDYLKNKVLNNENIFNVLNNKDYNTIIDAQNSQFIDQDYYKNFIKKSKPVGELFNLLNQECTNIKNKPNEVNEPNKIVPNSSSEEDLVGTITKCLPEIEISKKDNLLAESIKNLKK